MRRRSELHALLLLSTVWAWLTFVVACGAVMPRYERMAAVRVAEECCAHSPANDPCTTPSCGLVCAALFTVALSEHRIEVVPPTAEPLFRVGDEIGEAGSRQPPVPPPKAVA